MSLILPRNTLRPRFENQIRSLSSSPRSLPRLSLLHRPIALLPLPLPANHWKSTFLQAQRTFHPQNKQTTKTLPKRRRQYRSPLRPTKASRQRSATHSSACTADSHQARGAAKLQSRVTAMCSYGACRSGGGESRTWGGNWCVLGDQARIQARTSRLLGRGRIHYHPFMRSAIWLVFSRSSKAFPTHLHCWRNIYNCSSTLQSYLAAFMPSTLSGRLYKRMSIAQARMLQQKR